ncbi:MAG TPA: tRNA 4-thiouridine(8) synthase ThiI [bacterium]|nr:tRNA 4-thiouridine(8) synthase ThiI [bacterium]
MRALGLFSGGLDSMLAVEAIRRLGLEVVAVSFSSPFFGTAWAQEAAAQLGVSLMTLDVTDEYLAMLPHPKYGYGKNMNPCIDCKALMLRQAGKLMQKRGCDFIFSGEVLGQRPMSQNRQSLHIVAKLSGYEDYILRPLSAKLLPPILVQREQKLDTARLYDISGRGRQRQMLLAQEFGITSYPSPAGGCKLTEPGYARRLSRLYETDPAPSVRLFKLLGLGRHVRLGDAATLVVGRSEAENDAIERLAVASDAVLRVSGYVGPTGLLTTPCSPDEMRQAAAIVARYSDAPQHDEANVQVVQGGASYELAVVPIDPDEVRSLLV